MRTMHAIGSAHLGGAERFFARLAAALAAAGHPTTAVLRRGADLRDLLPPAVEVVETGMVNGADLGTWWTIRGVVLDRDPRVIQTYLGRASRLTRVPRRSPTVHVARLGGYYRPHAYRHADAWVGNTRGICDHLIRLGFPAARVHHITNFVERVDDAEERLAIGPARKDTGVPDDARLVFALGRCVAKKGFADLVLAFAGLPVSVGGRPVHLAIAGDGPVRAELEALAAELGLSGRVHWPGWRADPDPWFRAADVFVCPSRDEPLGNVVLEAWSHAVPVVSTRTAGPAELVTHGVDGVLVDIESPPALGSALWRLLEDEPERVGLARAGLDTVRRRHSTEVVVGAYLDLYGRVTRRRG
jgi:glycosyltransferase involved in cell wall biosynthesis